MCGGACSGFGPNLQDELSRSLNQDSLLIDMCGAIDLIVSTRLISIPVNHILLTY